jgi:hypothetical protein
MRQLTSPGFAAAAGLASRTASVLALALAFALTSSLAAGCSDADSEDDAADGLGGGDIVVFDSVGDSAEGDLGGGDAAGDTGGREDIEGDAASDLGGEDPGATDTGGGDDPVTHDDADADDDAEPDAGEEDAHADAGDDADGSAGGDDPDAGGEDEPDVTIVEDAPEPNVCDELATAARAEWIANAACESGAECRFRVNDLCPTAGGCYTYHAYDADLRELESIESRWSEESCATGDPCACDGPGVITCNRSRCGTCPSRCLSTCRLASGCLDDECGCPIEVPRRCDAIPTPLRTYAQTLTLGCVEDTDCTALRINNCGRISETLELGCYLPAPIGTSVAGLNALLQQNADLECVTTGRCICGTAPRVVCDRGACRIPEL